MVSPQFLLERSRAIGGSDVVSLFNLERGCERKLWYDKAGVPPDYPFDGNRHTRRGTAVEGPALEEFALQTGIPFRRIGWITHPEKPWAGVHLDAVVAGMAGDGVVEVKVPTSYSWYKWRAEGVPFAAQLQLQWGIALAQVDWGFVWAFNADRWEGFKQEVRRDDTLIANLLEVAERHVATWDWTENRHPKLDGDDPRCRECPWRAQCQGITKAWLPNLPEESDDMPEEVETLAPLVSDFVAARANVRMAEDALDAAKAELIAALGAQQRKVRCSAGRVTYAPRLRKEHTVKESRYYQLTVVPTKQEMP